MPSPEQPRRPEADAAPYLRAAAFADERSAGAVYDRVQETLFTHPCDLSAYRFLLNRVPHVAVLGVPPPPELDRALDALLATGEPAVLPAAVHQALNDRRRRMSGHGPWLEGHHRPGERL
jgi:hypothetical protein